MVYDFYPTIPIDKPKKYGLRGELQKDEPENYDAETCDRSGPQNGLGGGGGGGGTSTPKQNKNQIKRF